MGYEYNPWTGEYEETEAPAPAAVEPAVTPDPLATLGASSPTPVPGVTPEGSQTATATPVQPKLDPLAENRVLKGVNATARALAMPVTHPVQTVEALNEQVKGVFVDPFVQAAQNPEDIGKQLNPQELTRDTAGFALVPGYATAHDVQTPEGREQLAEHPEQVALDVLGVLPAGSLGKAAGTVPKAAGKVGSVLEKTAPGRSVVEKAAAVTAKAREYLPSPRLEAVQELPRAQRATAQQVNRNVGTLVKDLQKADLTPEQLSTLEQAWTHGVRPDDPKLASFFDDITEWSARDKQAKLERGLPDEMRTVLVDRVEAVEGPKMVAAGLRPEQAAQMFDAMRKGADNPIPEASKAWRKLNYELNRRHLAKTREGKLFEFDPGLAGIEPQVYPWREYTRLRAARRSLERKVKTLDPELHPQAHEAYRAVVEKYTPGKYEPALHQQKAALALAKNRKDYAPGSGRAAYDQMVGESSQTWLDLADQGVNPVYVPRQALKQLTDEVPTARARSSTGKPSSLKSSGGVAEFYETDPAVMLLKNEYELADQTTTQKAIAQVYRKTGGKSYERALQDYMSRGYNRAQAEKLIRSNYRGMKLDGTTAKAQPGELLVHRDVAMALDDYITQTKPGLVDEFFGAWMVPVLWMAPMFHVNNVAGGALMVGLKSKNSLLDYALYGREAWKAVKRGEMDSRVPFGAGMAPQYTKRFTRESLEREGGRLAALWNKVPGHKIVDGSRRFNEFMDSLNRTVVYMSKHDDAIKKGIDPWTAREIAGKEAANLMQNWDAFTPIERAIVQRVYPFWGFRKAMLRTILTYPLDHPLRMQFLYQLSRDQEERDNLPDEWDHLLGIGAEGKDGKRYHVSIKGLDPFADINDFFSFKGFLQNLHPLGRPLLEGAGIDSFRGGVPYFAFSDMGADIDPASGRLRRPVDFTDALWNLVPQVNAAATALGLNEIPPPEEPTPEGWTNWLDKYGSMLRLTPGISRRSEEEAALKYAENLKTWLRLNASAAKKRGESAPVPKLEAKVPATTPAPTPEPTGVTYNPWTGEYE